MTLPPTPDPGDSGAPEVDVREVAHRMRLATARLARLLRQQAGTGLSPSQHSVLVSIEHNGSLTLGALAALEQVAPPTITKIVSKLEDDGLVERTVDSRDRRVARVAVTGLGLARLETSRSRRDAWLTQRLERLSPEEVARVADALEIFEELVSQHDPSAPPTPRQPPEHEAAANP